MQKLVTANSHVLSDRNTAQELLKS